MLYYNSVTSGQCIGAVSLVDSYKTAPSDTPKAMRTTSGRVDDDTSSTASLFGAVRLSASLGGFIQNMVHSSLLWTILCVWITRMIAWV